MGRTTEAVLVSAGPCCADDAVRASRRIRTRHERGASAAHIGDGPCGGRGIREAARPVQEGGREGPAGDGRV